MDSGEITLAGENRAIRSKICLIHFVFINKTVFTATYDLRL